MENLLEPTETPQNQPATKRCSCCGKEKPVSAFSKRAASHDGYQTYCKECAKAANQRRKGRKAKTPPPSFLTTTSDHPTLGKFTPRELLEELYRRGFKGELEYDVKKTYRINLQRL